MKSNTGLIIRTAIVVIMLLIILVDAIVIRHLRKKIDNLTIITWQDSSLVKLSPKSINEPTIVVTEELVDTFNNYKSPFNDGMTFDELIKKYIRNRWSDHYGSGRGTREKKEYTKE